MNISEKGSKKCNRFRGVRPETEAKYRQAIELYRSTDLSVAEIFIIEDLGNTTISLL